MKHLEIVKNGDLYDATIGSRIPNSTQVKILFKSVEALTESDLTSILLDLGFHQRTILDEFDVANGNSTNIPHPLFEHQKDE